MTHAEAHGNTSTFHLFQLYYNIVLNVRRTRLFSEVVSRLFSSGVHSHDFYRNFCSACAVTIIFGHFNRSFLLNYLFIYLQTVAN